MQQTAEIVRRASEKHDFRKTRDAHHRTIGSKGLTCSYEEECPQNRQSVAHRAYGSHCGDQQAKHGPEHFTRFSMIGHCFNSECNQELRYLREGAVYQLESGVGREFHSEFFWLCPACSSIFKVASDENGNPLLVLSSLKREGDRRHFRIKRVFRAAFPESLVSELPEGTAARAARI